jgi:hypothetical protein
MTITDECAEVGGTAVAVTAYLRRPARNDSEYEVWELIRDGHKILEANASDLIFQDFNTQQDVELAFQLRCPASHHLLCRWWFGDTGRCMDPPRNLRLFDKVRVWKREWYAGGDVEELAELARQLGKVEVVDPLHWEDHCFWNGSRRGYKTAPSELAAHGCYIRRGQSYDRWSSQHYLPGPKPHYVVYDPKVVARRIKRADERAENHVDCGVPYITVAELSRVARELFNKVTTAVPALSVAFESADYYTVRRYAAVRFLHLSLLMCELVFGSRSYWQVEAFRDLMKAWKTKRTSSWTEFGRTCSGHSYTAVFNRLDAELGRRRPRKRELTARLSRSLASWR